METFTGSVGVMRMIWTSVGTINILCTVVKLNMENRLEKSIDLLIILLCLHVEKLDRMVRFFNWMLQENSRMSVFMAADIGLILQRI